MCWEMEGCNGITLHIDDFLINPVTCNGITIRVDYFLINPVTAIIAPQLPKERIQNCQIVSGSPDIHREAHPGLVGHKFFAQFRCRAESAGKQKIRHGLASRNLAVGKGLMEHFTKLFIFHESKWQVGRDENS